MLKYWIKNRFVFDFFISIVLALLFSVALVYPFNNNYSNVKTENNIYLNSEIDYQIPSPSKEQLEEIKKLSFIDDAFGYYATKTSVTGNSSSQINVLMSDNMDNLSITMFNNNTVIKSIQNVTNYAYVDKIAANALNVSCNDTLSITIAGSKLDYVVCGVYNSNDLYKEGTVVLEFTGSLKTLYEQNVSSKGYSAAFIKSSNNSECETYLRSYIPLGRLKDRSEFDSDEAYNAYNDAIKSGNYANEITNFAEKRNVAQKELSKVLTLLTIMSYVGAVVVGVLYFISNVILRNRKSEDKYFAKVLKDKRSIKTYRVVSFACGLFSYIIVSLVVLIITGAIMNVIIPFIVSIPLFLVAFCYNLIQDKKYIKQK